MRDVLLDIIKHTGNLGFLDEVKVTGKEDSTIIQSMDQNKLVILKGSLLSPVEEFVGEFGFQKMTRLKSFLDHPNYKDAAATMTVKNREYEGNTTIGSIIFIDAQGQTGTYNTISPEHLPLQPTFKGLSWDVNAEATKSKIQELASFSSIINDDPVISVKTENRNLIFTLGGSDENTDSIKMIFASDIDGTISSPLQWRKDLILPILKVGIEESPTISFSARGAMMMTLTTQFAVYEYILPALKN